jgi:hypothetical protein
MECSVCYEACGKQKSLRCGHVFCNTCIKEWYLKSEDPACPMCRRPIWFRGLLSSGWLQERQETKEGNVPNDLFEYYFNHLLEDYEVDMEEGYRPVIASRIFMHYLKRIQTTINAMWDQGYDEENIFDFVDHCDWVSERQKDVWFDDPLDKWFTQYPDRSLTGMMSA